MPAGERAGAALRECRLRQASSQVRPNRDVDAKRVSQVALDGLGKVESHDTDWRAPTHTDARADVQIKLGRLECIAAVNEHRRAPFRQEVVLDLCTHHGEIRAAYDLSFLVRRA